VVRKIKIKTEIILMLYFLDNLYVHKNKAMAVKTENMDAKYL